MKQTSVRAGRRAGIDMKIKVAELVFEFDVKYPYTAKLCRDYVVPDTEKTDIRIYNDENYEKELEACPDYPLPLLESLHIYRAICTEIVKYDGFLIHSSAVVLDGKAYIFAAPSGTGKSTHTGLWCEYFPSDRVYIINDDKPIIRKTDKFRVYGTPWCGKAKISKNTSADIQGICLLRRGKENKINRLDFSKALVPFMNQVYRCPDEEYTNGLLRLLDEFSSVCGFYELYCNISHEAVRVAYEGMSGKKIEEETK